MKFIVQDKVTEINRAAAFVRQKYNISNQNQICSDVFEREFRCKLIYCKTDLSENFIEFDSDSDATMFMLRFS